MAYYDQQDVLDATNGGLDVICSYFPDAVHAASNTRKKFRMFRPGEKSPSGSLLRPGAEGKWTCTDFGDDGKAHDCFSLVMRMEGLDFPDAIKFIAERYNVKSNDGTTTYTGPRIEKTPASDDQPDGWYEMMWMDVIPETHLREIFAERVYMKPTREGKKQYRDWEYLRKVCNKYFLHALTGYRFAKDGQVITVWATDENPLFAFHHKKEGDAGEWIKIYQPRAQDPQFRFRYFGAKPADVLNGLDQCIRSFNDANEKEEDPDDDDKEKKKKTKLSEILLGSGETDSLNVAAMGYEVVWMNSESQKLTEKQFAQLQGISDKQFILFDIDKTGFERAHELNMLYLPFRTIEIPAWIKKFKDRRGKPCKDIRDYIKHFSDWDLDRNFKNLLAKADPYQFWFWYYNTKTKSPGYQVNNASLYRFLQKNGYWRYRTESNKNGYIYILIKSNVVKEVTPIDIKNFIKDFLVSRSADVELRNEFLRTNQLSESSLSNLDYIEIDFTDYENDSQYFFFQNAVWKVSAAGIESFKPGEIDKYVWDEEVIKHDVKPLPPFFKVQKEDNAYHITINDERCLFLRFLNNASKMYWKVEAEGTPDYDDKGHKLETIRQELTAAEIQEQEHHLVNKLYTLGYVLHRKKDPSKAWAVWAMDGKIVDDSESHGGSGKSITFESLQYFMKYSPINGRNPKLTEDNHMFGDVTEHTDFVLINDCNKYLDFDFFFDCITGPMTCNPKHSQAYKLPFPKSPKIAFTSNYALRKPDPSKERRILYNVFSDYYHHGPTADYKEHRDPSTDLGKKLFEDFTEDEWNLFFNTMTQATQLFLQSPGKIGPPLDNVTKRNMKMAMGDDFKEWADIYFEPDHKRLDTLIPRELAKKDYLEGKNLKNYTTQKFTGQLKAWCEYNNYTLNPKDLQNKEGRIVRRSDATSGPVEMIYIQTLVEIIQPDKLPF